MQTNKTASHFLHNSLANKEHPTEEKKYKDRKSFSTFNFCSNMKDKNLDKI